VTAERARGWLETLWPIAGGVLLVVVSYARFDTRLTNTEATVTKMDNAWVGLELRVRNTETNGAAQWASVLARLDDIIRRLERIESGR
jgi:hypothetical protein